MRYAVGRRLLLGTLLLLLAGLISQTNALAVDDEITFIHEVQGNGGAVTGDGETVTIEGIVTGDFQGAEELLGFFIQEEDEDADNDPNTSEGIFVFCALCDVDVAEGDLVRVTGIQGDYFGMGQIDAPDETTGEITVISSGNPLPTPVPLSMPASGSVYAEGSYEGVEGMLVEFVDELTVTEYFQLARYGQIVLSAGGRQRQYTNDQRPTSQGLIAFQTEINQNRIILDDVNNIENGPDRVYHPQPDGFSTGSYIRGGDTVSNLTGVLHWSWAGSSATDAWRVRPTQSYPVTFTRSNPRTATPAAVGGDITVSTLNVLNFFTSIDTTSSRDVGSCGPSGSLDCRGADSVAELERQSDKLIAALEAINADLFALVEIENNASASLAALAEGLNVAFGREIYAYVDTGTIGSDAIKVGFLYNKETIGLAGEYTVYDSPDFTDPNGTGRDRNRPALAQTFSVIEAGNPSAGERFTAVVNHFKSKGSGCGGGDDDLTLGQGNCNRTRTLAGERLVDWLATDPTSSNDADFLILGDINAYAKEDPVIAIEAGPDGLAGNSDDYVNLVEKYEGAEAYSFVFDGQWGYLDHSLANLPLASQITGLTVWHINADEASLLNYDDGQRDEGEYDHEVKPGNGAGLYAADLYRVSDHDPVIIGLALDGTLSPAPPGEPTEPVDPGQPTAPTPTPIPSPNPPSGDGPLINLIGDPLNGDEGEGGLPVTVVLSEPASDDVSVTLSTVDGSASSGEDYYAFSRTITFLPGEISRSLEITLIDDALYERDEYLSIVLSNPLNGSLGEAANVRAVILEDDPMPHVEVLDAALVEADNGMGNMTFEISLDSPAAVDLTFDYATQGGTAIAGEDYIAASGRLLIPAGSRSGSISITIIGDRSRETDEHFRLALFDTNSGGLDAETSVATASGTITNDDGPPFIYLPFLWME